MEKNLADSFNRAFAEALPGHAERLKAKSEEKLNSMGAQGFAGIDSINDLEQTFCGAWPRVRGFLNFAIGMAGWAMPGTAAAARAVVTAIDKELVPNICDLPKQ